MANHYSALKRNRQTKKKTAVNRLRKTRLRHSVRAMRRLIEAKEAKAAQAAMPEMFSLIDRAAKWGIIKKNTASRYKSRLSGRVKSISAAA